MSSPTSDGLKSEIDAGRMRVGNPIQTAAGLPAATNVSQLTTDSSGNLQVTAHLPIVQPTTTDKVIDVTGISATGILVNTLVGGATVTTATIGGYFRVAITATGSGTTSGSYYVPFYVLT